MASVVTMDSTYKDSFEVQETTIRIAQGSVSKIWEGLVTSNETTKFVLNILSSKTSNTKKMTDIRESIHLQEIDQGIHRYLSIKLNSCDQSSKAIEQFNQESQAVKLNDFLYAENPIGNHDINEFMKILKETHETLSAQGGFTTKVALKILNKDCKQKDVDSFINEIRALKLFRGQAEIVQMIGYRCNPYMHITEYCNLGSLMKYFIKGGNLNEKVCFRISKEMATALHLIHSKNWVHRDFSTRNIFLYTKGVKTIHAKLGDFGEASPLLPNGKTMNRREWDTAPTYELAPEEIKGEKSSVYSDCWSYGCFLASLFTNGQLVFNGSRETHSQNLLGSPSLGGWSKKVSPLAEQNVEEFLKIPQLIQRIIHDCHNLTPKERPTMNVVLRLLGQSKE